MVDAPTLPAQDTPVAVHTGTPAASLFDKLPPAARDRYRDLKQRHDDLYRLQPEGEEVRQANAERYRVEKHLEKLLAPPPDWNLHPEDPRVIASQKELAALTDECTRLSTRYQQTTAARQVVGQTLHAVTQWLATLPPGPLADVEPPAVTLGKEGLLDAIKKHRAHADELRAHLKQISRAPVTPAMAKERARQEIEEHARRGQPNVAGLLRGGKLGWPSSSTQASIINVDKNGIPPIGFTEGVDVLGLFAAVFKRELTAHVDGIISEQAGKDGLTDEERAKQTADTSAKLLSVERIICALIARARAEWLPADFDVSLSPLAILSVIRVEPAAREPGSTPGYGFLSGVPRFARSP